MASTWVGNSISKWMSGKIHKKRPWVKFDRIASNVRRFPNAEVVFAQQEPKNMGAYSYCLRELRAWPESVCKAHAAELPVLSALILAVT